MPWMARRSSRWQLSRSKVSSSSASKSAGLAREAPCSEADDGHPTSRQGPAKLPLGTAVMTRGFDMMKPPVNGSLEVASRLTCDSAVISPAGRSVQLCWKRIPPKESSGISSSVLPNRRVGRADHQPWAWAEDSGPPAVAAAAGEIQKRPSECSPPDMYRWLPGCAPCCRRPDEWPWSGPGWAPSQRCCWRRGRNNGSRCRRIHRPRRLSHAELPQKGFTT